MFASTSAIFGLKYQVSKLGLSFGDPVASVFTTSLKYFAIQSRAVAAQLGETEKHRFLVGTSTLRESNEVWPHY